MPRPLALTITPSRSHVPKTFWPLLCRYGSAPAGVALAALLTGLVPSLEGTPYLLFFVPVIACALFGGLGPGLLAAVLSVLAVDCFFLYPVPSLAVDDLADMCRLGIFAMVALVISGLTGERKRAQARLRDYAERLQALSRRLLDLQEKERAFLAHELRDELGQDLTGILTNLQSAQKTCDPAALPCLEESIDLVQKTIRQTHSLALNLRPSLLDDMGLVAALQGYVARQAERARLVVDWVLPAGDLRLPAEVEITCFRVVQEAVTNVVRHARASRLWVALQEKAGGVQLIVHDDGAGFDVTAARQRAARGESFGLIGMRERVELLGGRFAITSERDGGTTITVCLPVAVDRVLGKSPQEAHASKSTLHPSALDKSAEAGRNLGQAAP
jgi:signal transduction histidine kinase